MAQNNNSQEAWAVKVNLTGTQRSVFLLNVALFSEDDKNTVLDVNKQLLIAFRNNPKLSVIFALLMNVIVRMLDLKRSDLRAVFDKVMKNCGKDVTYEECSSFMPFVQRIRITHYTARGHTCEASPRNASFCDMFHVNSGQCADLIFERSMVS